MDKEVIGRHLLAGKRKFILKDKTIYSGEVIQLDNESFVLKDKFCQNIDIDYGAVMKILPIKYDPNSNP